MLCPLGEAHTLKIFHGYAVAFFAAYILVVEWEGHILHGILKGNQVKRLKYKPDVLVAQPCCPGFTLISDQGIVEVIIACIVFVEDSQDI
jgi:hypothetical protein